MAAKRRRLTLEVLLEHPAVRGVAFGNCVDGGPWDAHHRAHAHAPSKRGSETREGWICIKDCADAFPELLLEELAHLVARTEGFHDATFQEARRQLRKAYRTR